MTEHFPWNEDFQAEKMYFYKFYQLFMFESLLILCVPTAAFLSNFFINSTKLQNSSILLICELNHWYIYGNLISLNQIWSFKCYSVFIRGLHEYSRGQQDAAQDEWWLKLNVMSGWQQTLVWSISGCGWLLFYCIFNISSSCRWSHCRSCTAGKYRM